MKRRFLLWCLLLVVGACKSPSKPTVILISIDGFRSDYFDLADTPNLDRLVADGVKAEALQPVFPANTFPNHYTIVTGLYPENHGIVDNTSYDPSFDAEFRFFDRESASQSRWWGGEPLWNTVENQGGVAAAMFWVGSDIEINGRMPTHSHPYDGAVSNEERVDTVLAWLDLPLDQRPSFITLYVSHLDDAGHEHVPGEVETIEAVEIADRQMGRLIGGLEERDLLDAVNIVVVSDHGMAPVSGERVVYLDDYVDPAAFRAVSLGSTAAIWPNAELGDEVYSGLVTAHPNMSVFARDEIPERFHYRNNERIPPVLAVADEGWNIVTRAISDRVERMSTGGAHGYDNELDSMEAIFVARGPAFRRGIVVDEFENIHIYSLLAEILGVEPAPNDGRLETVEHILVDRR